MKTQSTETVIIIGSPATCQEAYLTHDKQGEVCGTYDKKEAAVYPDFATSMKECTRLMDERTQKPEQPITFAACLLEHAEITL